MDDLDLDYYARLAQHPESEVTADQERSVEYYQAYVAPTGSESPRVVRWLERARALDTMVRELGRAPTADDSPPAGMLAWIKNQRRNPHLCEFQIDILNSIPAWSWDPQGDTWHANLIAAMEFHAEHGRWPRVRARDETERRLGHWLSRQRVRARRGSMPHRQRREFDHHLGCEVSVSNFERPVRQPFARQHE